MFQLLKECEGAANIVISGHIRPDGDCVGSCMATYLFLKRQCRKLISEFFWNNWQTFFPVFRILT